MSEFALTEGIILLTVAGSFGIQLVLAGILLPLASHAQGAFLELFLRDVLPKVVLLGMCASGLAVVLTFWRDRTTSLQVSCLLFVALGHAMARHMLRLRTVMAHARKEPAQVIKPLQMLASAQLAVAMVSVLFS